jgi:hypothetical protein
MAATLLAAQRRDNALAQRTNSLAAAKKSAVAFGLGRLHSF